MDLTSKLNYLEIDEILRISDESKTITLLGHFKCDEIKKYVIIIVKKTEFPNDKDIIKNIFYKPDEFRLIQHNDIYYTYKKTISSTSEDLSSMHTTFIYPASSKHIKKYTNIQFVVKNETSDMYLTHMEKILNESLKIDWIDNIINGTSEVENILYRNEHPTNGFVLLKDYKSDNSNLQAEMRYLVLSVNNHLYCLRELTVEHLPMLIDIKLQSENILCDKYKVIKERLLFYVHYPPSYYRFHVHIRLITDELHVNLSTLRCHLLSDIIDNLTRYGSDYYRSKNYQLLAEESGTI